MERRRAVMIDTRTGEPVDPTWLPMLAVDELPEANALMARNRLHFIWQWVPITQQLTGAAVLSTP